MELQKLMIIKKQTKELPLALILKSMLLSLVTWSLWGYTVYAIIRYSQKIFTNPVFEHYFFADIVVFMFASSVALLVIAIVWSFIAKPSKRLVLHHQN
ncbi:HmsD [Bisgaard Taxon 10/6]|uniref:HmsD n=2 Tax=Exercitatus varius TaxID=67857 RepID=A0ABT6EPV9_9PAST|nr:HmsD [Exercitatus varius]QOF66961.1 HmsD [Actinobacillus sp. GY-402]MDG2917439.1 HmsD [Exercitatus varius]MDG2942264.1 HmsD [Exercitatus varius]MDG2945577.1 HmsD [Exercitatus varius]MDG2956849.1 HmsD [Exercitatus varius]